MKSLLVFPPGWHPNGPYLALPALKSFLKENDIWADIRDLNIEFFNYILSGDYMLKCYEKLDNENRLNETLLLIKSSVLRIDEAKSILKSNDFFDDEYRQLCVNIIANALHVVKEAYEGKDISFKNIDLYYSRHSSEDVMKAANDRLRNLYIDYYEQYIIEQINKAQYEFIGISISGNSQIIPALTLAKLIKENCPLVRHVSLGGNYITRMALRFNREHIFFDYVDSIMLYDGEISIHHLIKAVENNQSLEYINNLFYVNRGNNEIIKNEVIETDYINDLIPDFEGFPLDTYFAPELVLPLYTSRSCFSHCAFCTIPKATSGKYRCADIDKVYDAMCILSKKYDVKIFCFVDETLNLRNMKVLAQKIIDNKDDFYWYGETRFLPNIDDELCLKLYQGGCRQIQFGLESYCQRVLDKMKKNIKVEWIEKTIRSLHKAHIPVHMFFFNGFPTETHEEAMATHAFTRKMLDEAYSIYQVPTSTHGFGPFGLEIGSDVWFNPDEYGIKVKEVPSDKDLKLNVDYEVKTGLTQEQSEALVNKQLGIYDISHKADISLPKKIVLSEKICVLDAIYKKPLLKQHYRVKRSAFSMDTIKHSHVQLAPNTYILNTDEEMVLYNITKNTTYKVNIPNLIKLILNQESIETIQQNIHSPNVNHILADLIYYELIEIIELGESVVNNIDGHKVVLNKDILWEYDEAVNMYIYFNPHTNSIIRVNKTSKTLLQAFIEPQFVSDIMASIKENNINIPDESITSLVTNCLNQDVLHLVR